MKWLVLVAAFASEYYFGHENKAVHSEEMDKWTNLGAGEVHADFAVAPSGLKNADLVSECWGIRASIDRDVQALATVFVRGNTGPVVVSLGEHSSRFDQVADRWTRTGVLTPAVCLWSPPVCRASWVWLRACVDGFAEVWGWQVEEVRE